MEITLGLLMLVNGCLYLIFVDFGVLLLELVVPVLVQVLVNYSASFSFVVRFDFQEAMFLELPSY